MCQGVALDGMFGRMKSKTVSQALDKLASVGEAISTYLMRFEQARQGTRRLRVETGCGLDSVGGRPVEVAQPHPLQWNPLHQGSWRMRKGILAALRPEIPYRKPVRGGCDQTKYWPCTEAAGTRKSQATLTDFSHLLHGCGQDKQVRVHGCLPTKASVVLGETQVYRALVGTESGVCGQH